jgi:hypothetical protein
VPVRPVRTYPNHFVRSCSGILTCWQCSKERGTQYLLDGRGWAAPASACAPGWAQPPSAQPGQPAPDTQLQDHKNMAGWAAPASACVPGWAQPPLAQPGSQHLTHTYKIIRIWLAGPHLPQLVYQAGLSHRQSSLGSQHLIHSYKIIRIWMGWAWAQSPSAQPGQPAPDTQLQDHRNMAG